VTGDAYRVLVGKPEGKRPLGGLGIDNIKMDLQDVRWWGLEWIDLAQDQDTWRAPVNAVKILQVP
jgi:hypothetical protein